jgi:hypothetical protein
MDVVEKKNTHFMSNNFFPDNRDVYKIMRKNVAETEMPPKMTIY